MRLLVAILTAIGCALLAPAAGRAADHLLLTTEPAVLDLAGATPAVRARLEGWRLAVTGNANTYTDWFPGAPVPVANGALVTAELISDRGGVREVHGVSEDAAPSALVFDGTIGTLEVHDLGPISRLELRIEAAGPTIPVPNVVCPPWGSLATVPVRVEGLAELRTGTGFFGSVRTHSFAGTMTYNPAGPGAVCYTTGTESRCPFEWALNSLPLDTLAFQAFWGEPERSVTLTAKDAPDSATGTAWGHVLSVSLRRWPFAGPASRMRVRVPKPLRGQVVFRPSGAPDVGLRCSSSVVPGTLTGRVAAAFHGFGLRARIFRSETAQLYRQPG